MQEFDSSSDKGKGIQFSNNQFINLTYGGTTVITLDLFFLQQLHTISPRRIWARKAARWASRISTIKTLYSGHPRERHYVSLCTRTWTPPLPLRKKKKNNGERDKRRRLLLEANVHRIALRVLVREVSIWKVVSVTNSRCPWGEWMPEREWKWQGPTLGIHFSEWGGGGCGGRVENVASLVISSKDQRNIAEPPDLNEGLQIS